ncbi:MAG: 6-bladed beta-propeller [Flavobacteriales bacterium]|nr:6-bladed beta-propeller [Flavobacteriales bacterium]
MKNNIYIVTFIFFSIFIFGCKNEKKDTTPTIKTISVDVEKAEKDKDISDIMDTSFFKVVALQTSQESLVGGKIKGIFYRNDKLYIWEEQTNSLFMFDSNGKYLNKIHSVGEGPNDYRAMSSVRMTKDRIYVFDKGGSKILYYDVDCNLLGTISVKDVLKKVFNTNEVFVINDRLYFADQLLNESKAKYGDPYKLCSMDMVSGGFNKYLPYNTQDAPSYNFYLRDQQYSIINDSVRLMCCKTDTVYVATKDNVSAEYILDFGDKSLPKNMIQENSIKEIKTNPQYNRYVYDITNMMDTDRYLIFRLTYGSMPKIDHKALTESLKKDRKGTMENLRNRNTNFYYVFYDKNTGNTIVANDMIMSNFGDNRSFISFSDGSYIFNIENIHSAFFNKEGKKESASIPQNKAYQNALNEVYSSITPQSNPIIHIYKLKQ